MSEVKISVVVPVYNVDKFLIQSLDSVVNQTFRDIEIICVNDGSTDKSRKILAEYAARDSRITIIDKKNGGLSSARNAGMKVAKGDYIAFVDSDDWIDETMLEKLYENAIKFDSQMSICAVHKYDDQTKKIVDDDPYFTLGYFDETFDNTVFNHEKVKGFLFDFCVMAWNKLYKRSFLEEYNAQFPDGLIFEDGPFFFSIFFKMDRVSIIRDFLYYYRVNRVNSIVQKGDKNFTNLFDSAKIMWDNIVDLPYFDEIKYDFLYKKYQDMNYRFGVIQRKYKPLYFKKFTEFSPFFDETIYDMEKIKKERRYMYEHFILLRAKSYPEYIFKKIFTACRLRMMYKIMEILYYNPNCYSFKIFGKYYKIRKRKIFLDIYYMDDFLYVILFKKQFKIPFKYSELETKDDNE